MLDDTIYLSEYDFNIGQVNNRNSFTEVVSCSKINNWLTTIQKELKSIQDNDVWDLVDLSVIFKPISCKWGIQE